MVSIYFCIYVCLYPFQSMPASWIWLILRRKAVEGPRRVSGHAKETRGQGTERHPQHHPVMGCIFHKDIGGHTIVHPMCFLQRNTATPPLHLVPLIDLNRKVAWKMFSFKEIIPELGWTERVRLKTERPRGRKVAKLRQEEQRWSERWTGNQVKMDAVGLRDWFWKDTVHFLGFYFGEKGVDFHYALAPWSTVTQNSSVHPSSP